jgi:hypothetical protein
MSDPYGKDEDWTPIAWPSGPAVGRTDQGGVNYVETILNSADSRAGSPGGGDSGPGGISNAGSLPGGGIEVFGSGGGADGPGVVTGAQDTFPEPVQTQSTAPNVPPPNSNNSNQSGSGNRGFIPGLIGAIGSIIRETGGSVGRTYLDNWLRNNLGLDEGSLARNFWQNFVPELKPWEWGQAGGAASGAAQVGQNQVKRDELSNAMQIAKLKYKQAVDTAQIGAAAPNEQARLAGQRNPSEIRRLNAQEGELLSQQVVNWMQVDMIDANIRNVEAQTNLTEIQSAIEQELGRHYKISQIEANMFNSMWGSIYQYTRAVDEAIEAGPLGTARRGLIGAGKSLRRQYEELSADAKKAIGPPLQRLLKLGRGVGTISARQPGNNRFRFADTR